MKKISGPVYTAPLLIWMTVLFVVPICIIFLYSFLTKGLHGGVIWRFTLTPYISLANWTFIQVTLNTLLIAILSTAIMVLLALPASYCIARSRYKNFLLMLVIIPFWTDFIIRIYAWIAILGNNGIINSFLINWGVIGAPIQLLYNKWAVITVTAYTYLPYAILPLYSSIEKFDFHLLEAARDLGATKSQSIFKILLPNVKAGISTAIIFTFIPAFGSYAVPQILGGRDSLMLGNIIARELTITRNWPLAASISVCITLITTIGVLLFMRLNRSATSAVKTKVVAELDEEVA